MKKKQIMIIGLITILCAISFFPSIINAKTAFTPKINSESIKNYYRFAKIEGEVYLDTPVYHPYINFQFGFSAYNLTITPLFPREKSFETDDYFIVDFFIGYIYNTTSDINGLVNIKGFVIRLHRLV